MASHLKNRFAQLRMIVATGLLVLGGLVAPIVAGSVATARPEDAGFSSERLRAVQETIQRYIDAGDITGAVTLVASRGRIVHFEAHGLMNLESKRPMAKDSVFRIMSMTKPVTAVAVMMMEEEGKLRVTDPVSKFIPEFKQLNVLVTRPEPSRSGTPPASGPTVPAKREITISDLLTHTSGMGSGLQDRQPDDTLATLMPRYATVPLRFQPGADWEYSGIAGPDVLARIVEIVSGQNYEQFLRTRIFGPLGMKETSHFPTDAQRPRVVTLYTKTPAGFVPSENPDRFSGKTYFSGSAGLVSTAEDYLQFAQMLCGGGELNGKRLLKPQTVRRIATNYVGDMFNGKLSFPKRGFGFGYLVAIVQNHTTAEWQLPDGSFGWFGAYGSQVWINPKEQLVTLLMIQNLAYPVQRDFEAAVVRARLGAGVAPTRGQPLARRGQ
jgi:CubicO group peptidase (beta-lactamase class C family)